MLGWFRLSILTRPFVDRPTPSSVFWQRSAKHIFVQASAHASAHVSVHMRVRIRLCTCLRACLHAHLCISTHMHVCRKRHMSIYVCLFPCVYIHVHTSISMHTHMSVHKCLVTGLITITSKAGRTKSSTTVVAPRGSGDVVSRRRMNRPAAGNWMATSQRDVCATSECMDSSMQFWRRIASCVALPAFSTRRREGPWRGTRSRTDTRTTRSNEAFGSGCTIPSSSASQGGGGSILTRARWRDHIVPTFRGGSSG